MTLEEDGNSFTNAKKGKEGLRAGTGHCSDVLKWRPLLHQSAIDPFNERRFQSNVGFPCP
jgi:hypothetical protein